MKVDNVRQKCQILTDLYAVDSEHVCKKPQNFVQKYCLTKELLIFKCR